jgi:hypothetical protein
VRNEIPLHLYTYTPVFIGTLPINFVCSNQLSYITPLCTLLHLITPYCTSNYETELVIGGTTFASWTICLYSQQIYMTMVKLHYITFYTDDLKPAEVIHMKGVKPHVDSYTAFSRDDVIAMGGEHYVHCFDDVVMRHNPGLQKCGMGAWKPYLLLHMLEREDVADGDIIMYKDVNVIKYPNYLLGVDQFKALAEEVLNEVGCDVFMPVENTSYKIPHHCKMQVVRELGVTKYGAPEADICEYPLLIACMLLVRKSESVVKMLKEWLDAVAHHEWLLPTPNENPHPSFRWHTPEQGVFSVLCAAKVSKGELPKDYPKFLFTDRKFQKDKMVKCR